MVLGMDSKSSDAPRSTDRCHGCTHYRGNHWSAPPDQAGCTVCTGCVGWQEPHERVEARVEQPALPEFGSLAEARAWLLARVDEGVKCPCCTQLAKVYRRKVNSGMARSLITLYRKCGREYGHVPTVVGARSREEGKLAYWGLVEELQEKRDDGGRAGWWRVTDMGERFVLNQVRVYKYARVYDGRVLSLVGEPVSIRDALGTKFDYNELMEGR